MCLDMRITSYSLQLPLAWKHTGPVQPLHETQPRTIRSSLSKVPGCWCVAVLGLAPQALYSP